MERIVVGGGTMGRRCRQGAERISRGRFAEAREVRAAAREEGSAAGAAAGRRATRQPWTSACEKNDGSHFDETWFEDRYCGENGGSGADQALGREGWARLDARAARVGARARPGGRRRGERGRAVFELEFIQYSLRGLVRSWEMTLLMGLLLATSRMYLSRACVSVTCCGEEGGDRRESWLVDNSSPREDRRATAPQRRSGEGDP